MATRARRFVIDLKRPRQSSVELRRIPALPPTGVDLGRALRRLRRARGLRVGELAWMADLDPRDLSLLERGRADPTWFKLCDLAGALGVPVSTIARDAERAAQFAREERALRREREAGR
jgi:transcriptional regulator with XRE-family HTH domain